MADQHGSHTPGAGPDGSAERDPGFRIEVPDSWWELEIRPEARDAAIERMVERRLTAGGWLAEHREAVESFLRHQARDAWNGGAVYASCLADPLGGRAPVTASVSVSFMDARPEGGPDTGGGEDAPRSGSAAGQRARWQKSAPVRIPETGSADRSYGVEDMASGQHPHPVRMVVMRTAIPVPGSAERIALVSGRSEVVELADSFLEVFDAITSTFRFR